jgi:small subunit ribosomal protein S6
MYKYEMTLILNPNMTDELRKAEFEKIIELLSRFGGTVDKIDEWGKRRLAYEIEKISEGYYIVVYFTGEPTTPHEIEDRLRINEHLLRYLIIRPDK